MLGQVSDGFREEQIKHKIPAHKVLSTVRTMIVRWSNTKGQITRNNVMRPIIDPVLSLYRREHAGDEAMIELRTDDDDSSDESQPAPQFAAPSRTLVRKDIKFTDDAWNANLEAESFLTRPHEIKEIMEHRPTVTGAQAVQMLVALKKQNGSARPLSILQHPLSISLAHRRRASSSIKAEHLNPLIETARRIVVDQLDQRFVQKRFSDARLIAIFMSKQQSAAKVLSESNYAIAKGLYLKWLRQLVTVVTPAVRRSPRKKQKRDLFEGMSSDEDAPTPAPEESDQVRSEVRCWEGISPERTDVFKGPDGLLDEFKLAYAVREEVPLHYLLFKQVNSHLGNEANAEDTFSLSGKLSNPNTKTGPGYLASLVRINKNRACLDPVSKVVLTAYKLKFRKLPTMGDDVTDDEGSDAGDGGDEEDIYESD